MMQFRQAGSRDRRRRVLLEEPAEGRAAQPDDAANSPSSPAKSYPDDALPEHQARVTDLLPSSAWSLAAAIVLLTLGIASVELLHLFFHRWNATIGAEHMQAFNLESPANVGNWFSSITFFLAACASVLIYSLRRHRHDDYRGRYRVWLTAAFLFLVASIDAASGLRRTVAGLLTHASGNPFGEHTPAWTLLACAVAALVVILRLWSEIFRSRGAMAGLGLTIAAYGLAAAVWLGAAPSVGLEVTPLTSLITCTAAAMTGHVAALLTVLLYGRYVMLDAQGKLPERKAKKAKKRRGEPADESGEDEEATLRIDTPHHKRASSTAAEEKTSERKIRVDAAQTKKKSAESDQPAPAKNTASAKITKAQLEAADLEQEEASGQNLSKAERRKLRKQRRSSGAA